MGKGNVDNLKPFQPGQSGNPAGKPKGTLSLTALLRKKLNEVPPGEERKTRGDLLVEATIRDAENGDGQSRKLCWEYIDGKAVSRIAGADGGPLQVEVTDARERLASLLDPSEPDA